MLRRTPLNRIGKVGRRNQEANKINYGRMNDLGITHCELCPSSFGLAGAHKHPREWYRSCPELLSDESHVIYLCQKCHDRLDDRSITSKEESDETFDRLRT